MTQMTQQSLIMNVLRQVSSDRLQRAVTTLVENTASVTLTRSTETDLRALIRTREGHEYGVTVTEAGVFCSCRDALYRGQMCKHATVLALTVLRTCPTTREIPRTIHLVSSGGVALCGVQHPLHVWKWPYWPEHAWKESCAGCEKIRQHPASPKPRTVVT